LIRYPEIVAETKRIIELLKTKRIIGANYGFDADKTYRLYGIDLMPYLHTDVQEAWHLLDENNSCGLKQVGERLWGSDAGREKALMKASVLRNGGLWQEKKGGDKEMYKADADLLGMYGAKDGILTLKNFYEAVPRLFEQRLDKFFYEEESMPLIKGPTYQMNTTGLRLDLDATKKLEKELVDDCTRLRLEIQTAIAPHVKHKYPKGFGNKPGQFNIGSSQQMAWLLFIELKLEYKKLTDGGRALCKSLMGKLPYNLNAKRAFIRAVQELDDPKKQPQKYLKCDKDTLTGLVRKQEWLAKLLQYNAYGKLLKTYVKGMQKRVRYGILHPNFLQHGTTSGRYSSNQPNFQNLPRDDKRVKKCVISRPGKVFVGADYSQLEPRVFASVSQDQKLMDCFAKGEDFYSVVGIPVFKKFNCSTFKKADNAFDKLYPMLRQNAKTLALATPYGQTAFYRRKSSGTKRVTHYEQRSTELH
jgi:DNA polymerase I-like protein with 3'-5' exonuclease and polymerase domains